MRVGFALLAHENPDQVAVLARHLTGQGAPVAIHLDRRATCGPALNTALQGAAEVISIQASEWGMFPLVEATLDLARSMLRHHSDLTHLYLISGACLPLRPVAELEAFLASHPGTDFIETARPEDWVTGGLDRERFTLYHPFPWKRRRKLFDAWVEIQRRLRINRRMSQGLEPRCGRQWWCLTRATLERLLSDPRLPEWRRFFRTVWIPDESFFPTIAASYGHATDPRPLTLTRFDGFGNPLVFHDDHIQVLSRAPQFFARKADPDAEALHHWAFAPDRPVEAPEDGLLDTALADRDGALTGLQMPGRYPRGFGVLNPGTARRFTALIGEDAGLLQRLRTALEEILEGARLHGSLFGPGPAEFAGGGTEYQGNLSADPLLRDYRPEQFLARLIWIDRARPVAFLFHVKDQPRIRALLARDPNASAIVIADPEVPDGPKDLLRIDPGALERELVTAPGPLIAQITAFILGDSA